MQNDSSSFRREAHASAFKNPPSDVLKNISPDATLSFDFQDLHSSPSSLSALTVANTPNQLTIATGIPSRELKSLTGHSEQDPKINSPQIFSHDTHSDMPIPNSVSHFHPNLHDNLHVTNIVESFICYDQEDNKDIDVDKTSIERTNHSSQRTASDPPDNESTFDCNDSLYLSNLWGKDHDSITNHQQKAERKGEHTHDSSFGMLGKENADNKHLEQVCQDMIENSSPVESSEVENRPVASKSVSVFSSSTVQDDPFRGTVESQKWFFENPGSTTNFSNATQQQDFESNLQSKFDPLVVPAQVQECPKTGVDPSSVTRMGVKKYKWKPDVHENIFKQQTSDPQAFPPGRDMARPPSRPKTIVDKSKATFLTKKGEKRKPRTYSQAIPSQHCHICSRRPTEASPHAVCGNLLRGRCRKTICTKCFQTFRWDLKAARDGPPGSWECPHCRGECPQRAQCVIYNRTSDRRRLKLINHRKRKASAVLGGGGGDKDRGKRTGVGLKKSKDENSNKVNINDEVNNYGSSSESGRRGIAGGNALRNSSTMNINNSNSLSCGDSQNLTIGKEAFLDGGGMIRNEEIGAWNNPDQIANFGQLERALAMDLIHQPNNG